MAASVPSAHDGLLPRGQQCPGDGVRSPGCRLGTPETCSLLAMASARDIEGLWRAVLGFFADFAPIARIELALAAGSAEPRVVRCDVGPDHRLDSPDGDALFASASDLLARHPRAALLGVSPGPAGEGRILFVVGPPPGLRCASVLVLAWRQDAAVAFVRLERGRDVEYWSETDLGRLHGFQPALAAMLTHFVDAHAPVIHAARWEAALAALPPWKIELGRFVAEGASNKEIADRLGHSEASIKFALHDLYRALGVRNRAEFAVGLAASEPVIR
jgi:DNA-binding CsgD family transcriptional regulator